MNTELKNTKIEEIDNLLLKHLEIVEPRQDLFFDCLTIINKKKIFRIRMQLAASAISALSLVLGIVFNWSLIAAQIAESQTGTILSLFFSDLDIVLANWQYYSFYLLESLPIVPIVLGLAGLFIILILFKLLIQELSYKNYLITHK